VSHAYQALAIDERRRQFEPTLWVQPPGETTPKMEQVWFAGVHSSVGGGSRDSGLSNQALLWMMEKAKAAGLAVDEAYVGTLEANVIGPYRDSWRGAYRFFPPLPREIDRPIDCEKKERCKTYETVHDSARERLKRAAECLPVYMSGCLDAYLARQEVRETEALAAHGVEAAGG
jgi:hypothetical protein